MAYFISYLMRRRLLSLIIPVFYLFFSACKNYKPEDAEQTAFLLPDTITTTPILIPVDSMPKWKIEPLENPKIINVSLPKLINRNPNVFKAGKPAVILAGQPGMATPGNGGVELPESIPFNIVTVPCITKPMQKALEPDILDAIGIKMDHIDVEQGLASSFILTIFQDSKGNIWIGTNGEGVIKYNGSSFTQFSTTEGLLQNWVRCILEDKNGNLWFGTDEGVVKYNGNTFTWITDKISDNGFIRSNIWGMAEDKEGNIWFNSVKDGVYKYDGTTLKYYTGKQGLSTPVRCITKDKNGNLWFGSINGIFKYDGYSFSNYTAADGLLDNDVKYIMQDKDENMWIATDRGVSKFNLTQFTNYTIQEGLIDNNINSIVQDKEGYMWFGSETAGICKLEETNFYYYTTKEGLSSNLIRCLFKDRSGKLWVGSYGGGIIQLNQNLFRHFGKQIEEKLNLISAIAEDKEGNIWFGTEEGIITKFDGNSFSIYPANSLINCSLINDIFFDKKGNLWFSFSCGQLGMFNGQSFAIYKIKNQNEYCLIEDQQGKMWVATIDRSDTASGSFFPPGFKMKHLYGIGGSRTFCQDRQNNVWLNTYNGMITKFDGRTFTSYPDVTHGPVSEVKEDANGNILFATFGDGLIQFDGNNFLNITKKQGLSDNRIRSIISAPNGNLWLGTEKGLTYLINPPDSNDHKNKIRIFNSGDGLYGKVLQERAALLDSKGNAWWGTNRGINFLNTKEIKPDTSTPVVLLNDIVVGERFIDFHHLNDSLADSRLPARFHRIKYSGTANFFNYPLNPVFPFELNHLAFNFNTVDWSLNHNLKYSYIVEGLDKNWSSPSPDNSADYRNIPYGKYTFKVKAIGTAQKWSPVFEYPFTIAPPWWHTWWFRTIAGFALLFVIYRYIKHRTRSLLARQQFLQLTVEKRTEQLRSSLSEKELLLKEIHHRVKNNLEVISSLLLLQTNAIDNVKAKEALAESQQRIQSIALIHHKLYENEEGSSVELKGFANELFHQLQEVFNKPGVVTNLQLKGNNINLPIDTAIPLGLILNELFTNAFKYAVQSNQKNIITVSLSDKLSVPENLLLLTFSDNGPGLPLEFNMDTNDSLGMKVIKLLTRQLQGTLTHRTEGGAIFEFTIPVKPSI